MAVTVAVVVTIVVAVAAMVGAPVFAAGAGSSAVVAYVAVANRLIHDARRNG